MAKYDYDLIVIGGGAAGLTASTGAASVGAKTLLIEKEEKLGGDCLHYGCVPSKSLIKSAYVHNVLKHSERYGLPKVDVPPVDFVKVRDRIKNIIASIQVHDEPDYIKEKYKVETRFGSPKFFDNHTIQLNGDRITSKRFILAMGSSPVVPPIEGIKEVDYVTNIDIFSLDQLPSSMIVLGGGPIGLEMAQAFSRLGSKVTIIQSGEQLLPKEDEDVAAFVKLKLEEDGITIHLHSRAEKVQKQNGRIMLKAKCKKTDKEIVVEGDMLLVSAGRKANVEGIDLEKAGIQYTPKGIKVDKRLRTTTKNIYACGDINGGYQFTHVAAYESGIAMMNAVFHVPFKADYKNVPWCTYLDPEVASVGYNERSAKEAGIDYKVHKEELKNNDRAKAEGETDGFIKVIINKKGVPIGCQIVAYHAGDLIHQWVIALNGKVSLNTIGNAIHAYPTLSEINKLASFNYFINASPLIKLRLLLNWRW